MIDQNAQTSENTVLQSSTLIYNEFRAILCYKDSLYYKHTHTCAHTHTHAKREPIHYKDSDLHLCKHLNRNVPHRLMYFNAWFLGNGATWEGLWGMALLEHDEAFLEEMYKYGCVLRFQKLKTGLISLSFFLLTTDDHCIELSRSPAACLRSSCHANNGLNFWTLSKP